MTFIGCTGHQSIPKPARQLVLEGISAVAASYAPQDLIGVCSLALGADQIFAEKVLQLGGQIHAVIPSESYETTFRASDQDNYHRLLRKATKVEVLPFDTPSQTAFLAAGHRVVDLADLMIAIWDGEPARGLGGTADIVDYARSKKRPIRIIWPKGVKR